MKINSQNTCDTIELQTDETLVVSSTYEMIKKTYTLKNLKSVYIKVYDNFFVIEYTDKNNKRKQHAFSDTWDFSII